MTRLVVAALAVMIASGCVLPYFYGGAIGARLTAIPHQVDPLPAVGLTLLELDQGWFASAARYRLSLDAVLEVDLVVDVAHGPVGWAGDGLFVGAARGRAQLHDESAQQMARELGVPQLLELLFHSGLTGLTQGWVTVPVLQSELRQMGGLEFDGLRAEFSERADGIDLAARVGKLVLTGEQGVLRVRPSQVRGRLARPQPATLDLDTDLQLRLQLPSISLADRALADEPNLRLSEVRWDWASVHRGGDVSIRSELRSQAFEFAGVIALEALQLDATAALRERGASMPLDGAWRELEVSRLAARSEHGVLAASGRLHQGWEEPDLAGEAALRMGHDFAANLLAPWPGLLEEMLEARWLVPVGADGALQAQLVVDTTTLTVNGVTLPRALLPCGLVAGCDANP